MDTEKEVVERAKQFVNKPDRNTEKKLRKAYEQLRKTHHGDDLVYAVAQQANS